MKKMSKNKSSQERNSIGRFCIYVLMACALALAGCESLRFAPSEAQKQNAWLHNRTAIITAETARSEDASEKLQALTRLSESQSRTFTSYCGLPSEFPQADTAEEILAEANWQIARTALSESAGRPDTWQLADSALELAIGICALLGGVYGTKAVRFLTAARVKSQALREIIEGNELFKKQAALLPNDKPAVLAFKEAHKDQSPQTRQIVTGMKP